MSFRLSVVLVFLLELIVALWAVASYGWDIEGLQATTRYSGRLSLLLFSILFLFAEKRKGLVRPILSERPYATFALAHGIHLIELLSYVYLSQSELIPTRLAGGFIAYLMIFAMPVLHDLSIRGQLTEKRFKVAHTIYLYYVWFIFFMSYLPRVMGKLPHVGGSYGDFVVLLAWVCVLLGVKISQLLIPVRSRS